MINWSMTMGKTKRSGPRDAANRPPKGQGMGYKDYDPCKVNPLNQQFEPTDACPIPRRAQQAGVK